MIADTAIPFNRATLTGNELTYMSQAIEAGHISGAGHFTRRAEVLLSGHLSGARTLLTTSCTHALEMMGLLLNLGPEDEVIMPSFAFPSAPNAVALRGARPVFVDIDPVTLNIDPECVAAAVTRRTAAVLVVNYAGVGCDMDALIQLLDKSGIALLEDNAHGLFGTYRGRRLGTFGAMGALSFHETKNVTCGEGGALILNDPLLVERAEVIREKGTNRAQFFAGKVDKYSWQELGSSYVLSEMLAAFLVAQLENQAQLQRKRMVRWKTYATQLVAWAGHNGFSLPNIPEHCAHPAHLFHMLAPNEAARDRLLDHLSQRSILGVSHFQPLHLSAQGVRILDRPTRCPVTEDVSARILRLPLFAAMTDEEMGRILTAVSEFAA